MNMLNFTWVSMPYASCKISAVLSIPVDAYGLGCIVAYGSYVAPSWVPVGSYEQVAPQDWHTWVWRPPPEDSPRWRCTIGLVWWMTLQVKVVNAYNVSMLALSFAMTSITICSRGGLARGRLPCRVGSGCALGLSWADPPPLPWNFLISK